MIRSCSYSKPKGFVCEEVDNIDLAYQRMDGYDLGDVSVEFQNVMYDSYLHRDEEMVQKLREALLVAWNAEVVELQHDIYRLEMADFVENHN